MSRDVEYRPSQELRALSEGHERRACECAACTELRRRVVELYARGGDRAEPRGLRQLRAAAWCAAAFGSGSAASPAQRAARFLEEAIELYQALGGDEDLARRLVERAFGRPPGEPAAELGDVGLTLLSLAEAVGLSADREEAACLARVVDLPLEVFAERARRKSDEGLDALVLPNGDEG